MNQIENIDDVQRLFSFSVEAIQSSVDEVEKQLKQAIETIVAVPADKRTFANTPQALDHLTTMSDFAIFANVLQILELSSPDSAVRGAAHDAMLKLEALAIDFISNNKQLYHACKEYAEGTAQQESLNDEQQFYLKELIKGFKRAGLDLPDDQLEEIKKIKKELATLTLDFDTTIAQDASKITVTKEGLQGLDDDCIKNLEQTEDGSYVLGVDYPTYFAVMENVEVEDTRKRLFKAFQNRAYPKNDELLRKIIVARDKLARLLGYKAYCELDLDDQMVKGPERALAFLQELVARSTKKELQELELLKEDLPPSVELSEMGKIKPWDFSYLCNRYKKKHFDVDEAKIAEYFPMEHTVSGLLDIYRTFLSLDFEEVPTNVWHKDVSLIKVFNSDRTTLLGYLLLDLFPRPNKYSHAAHAGVIKAVKYPDGTRSKTVSVVWANFPKSTQDKPSLLQRNDVKTFFHEFGHALHAVLGATQMGSFAGTSVKRDFVELPSQMLEEWLNDKQMLQKISCHYKTGESLSEEMLTNIMGLKTVFSGTFVQRQVILSLLSLSLYGPGENKDPDAIFKQLQQQYSSAIAVDPDNHMYASFGHLTGYGAKYYGYLWSRVFALDVFDQIKQHGLLNPVIGQKYIEEIIGKGGSKDPDTLLQSFLGRPPSQEAFLRDLGLDA